VRLKAITLGYQSPTFHSKKEVLQGVERMLCRYQLGGQVVHGHNVDVKVKIK